MRCGILLFLSYIHHTSCSTEVVKRMRKDCIVNFNWKIYK